MSLVRQLESGQLDAATFHHADHVELAWRLLQTRPLPEAMIALRDGLKRLTAQHGVPRAIASNPVA